MSSGIESTVPLNTRFLIAYNPFKVFENKSTVTLLAYMNSLLSKIFRMMFKLSMLFSFMKNLKSSRNALPIICSVCGLLPDVSASTNKSIGWREGDIVHRLLM